MLCFPVVMSILAFQSVKCQSLLLGKPNVCNQDEAVREAILSELKANKKAFQVQLQALTSKHQAEATKLINDMTELKMNFSRMQTEQEMINDRTRYELSETVRKINALPAHNGKIGSQSAMVSFSTYKRTTLQTRVNNERIVFEEVRSNNGGGYDNSTGIFTVPVDGTYYFFVSILTTSPGEFELILKENPRLPDCMFLITDTSGLVQTSNSVVANMKAGDKVSVRTHFPRGPGIYTVYRYWSSFTGFLIHKN